MVLSRAVGLGIGTIPIVGDIADFLYRSNIQARNIFRKHFEDRLKKEQEEGAISPKEERELRAMAGQDV